MANTGTEIQSQFKSLLQKKMDRQGFLKHVAVGAMALIGGGALLRLAVLDKNSSSRRGGSAYGAESVYGGGSRAAIGSSARKTS